MTLGDPLVKEHSIKEIKQKIKWVNTISIAAIHLLALYSVITITPLVRWQSFLWGEYLLHQHFQHLITYSYNERLRKDGKMEGKY
jgi:uncharacterized membrane protein